MGGLISKALRPLRTYNIENRALREIAKEKTVPAPKYASNIIELQQAMEMDPAIMDKLNKKDPGLDERLQNVYVTSQGRPEDDITNEVKSSSRILPQDRQVLENYEFGFKEPERVPYGRTTLRDTLNFLSSHQASPEEVTIPKIALEYKLKQEDVENIVKYFKTFEVYLPATKHTDARFAGPAKYRQMANERKQQIEGKDPSESEVEKQ